MESTAFGAPIADPKTSAAVLRAISVRAGLELRDVSLEDSASAVVAADLWSRITGIANLGAAGTLAGPIEVAAAKILARAAGYGGGVGDGELGYALGSGSEVALSMVESYTVWVETWVGGGAVAEVLAKAGGDLLVGGGDLEAAGTTLLIAADQYDAV